MLDILKKFEIDTSKLKEISFNKDNEISNNKFISAFYNNSTNVYGLFYYDGNDLFSFSSLYELISHNGNCSSCIICEDGSIKSFSVDLCKDETAIYLFKNFNEILKKSNSLKLKFLFNLKNK